MIVIMILISEVELTTMKRRLLTIIMSIPTPIIIIIMILIYSL